VTPVTAMVAAGSVRSITLTTPAAGGVAGGIGRLFQMWKWRMRAWIIVLSSTVLALAAGVAVMRPELASVPRAAVLPSLVPLLPTFVVTVLAAYALCALLATTGELVAQALRVRQQLTRNSRQPGQASADWTAAFGDSGFRRLLPPPAPKPVPADATVLLQRRFEAHEARREVARLYYISAARTHFFSALLILAAAVVLGAAQSQAALPLVAGVIPTVPAALAVAGLVLLALLARIAVDVAAEPLIDTISRLPAESAEAGWLRRVVELLATRPNARREAAADIVEPNPERLGQVFEQDHRALAEAIERLTATTEGLAMTTRSSVEALEAAFRASEMRELAAVQDASTGAPAITELREAVISLTAILQGIRAAPAAADSAIEPGSVRRDREPDLALELRKLLQEIGTTP
jgi:hypothetical protein